MAGPKFGVLFQSLACNWAYRHTGTPAHPVYAGWLRRRGLQQCGAPRWSCMLTWRPCRLVKGPARCWGVPALAATGLTYTLCLMHASIGPPPLALWAHACLTHTCRKTHAYPTTGFLLAAGRVRHWALPLLEVGCAPSHPDSAHLRASVPPRFWPACTLGQIAQGLCSGLLG